MLPRRLQAALIVVMVVAVSTCRTHKVRTMIQNPLPGASLFDDALAGRLAAALEGKGAAYVPRTHHLVGKAPKFTNRLILEASPYLLQHAHNPVSWYPWGDEAFAEARRLGRPVFLSVGYSTCHWCHVMEGESFEDEEIAAYMNANYVCIKVDREERPDVDAIYMSAVQAVSGGGGWPMSVWLNPDRQPFFGGTYFPPRDGARGAQHGFLTVLRDLHGTYTKDGARVAEAAASLARAVKSEMEAAGPAASVRAGAGVIGDTVTYFKRAFDDVHGGIRRAPKFPSNIPVRLLLRYHRRAGDAEALNVATVTLEKMAAGGLYDQIAGGFHRYSTDARWLVPHFEKMLYDNALLVVAYAEAHQATGRADFARVARETLDYVLREMTAPEGAFYSATDADSEGEEGKFFVWSEREIKQILGPGPETARFLRYYGVTAGGNFENANILNVAHPDEAEWAALAPARARLYEVRARRVPPLRDEKILAAWNGLAISAFAVGGRVLGEARYVEAAARAARFLVEKMRPGGRLARSFKDGRAAPPGFLDDYAFVTAGLLDLYEASFDRRWLEEAVALGQETDRLFADPARGGWFMTAGDHEKLLAREKPAYDGAEPSGTSVALLNALRLGAFTGDERWRKTAEGAFGSIGAVLAERPIAMTEALLALDFATDAVREVAVVWPRGATVETARPLLEALRKTFLPNRVLAAGSEDHLEALVKIAGFAEAKPAQAGKATAYVCEHGRCELPTGDPAVLVAQLAKTKPY